jgi:signal peptidase I
LKKSLRFLLALLTAFILMLVVRAVGVTVYSVDGDGLLPLLQAGDRVMVNRWSYGLRVGDGNYFNYGRLWHQAVHKGDLVAFESPTDGQVIICRCKALPGETVEVDGRTEKVPSLQDCADADYYWMETVNPANPLDSRQLGFIAEPLIIGRAFMVVFSHEPSAQPWKGWRTGRTLLPL